MAKERIFLSVALSGKTSYRRKTLQHSKHMWLLRLNAALGLAFLVTLALPLSNVIALFYVRYIIFNLTV